MTTEFYLERKKELEKNYKTSLNELNKLYALQSNPYQIGDIISDRFCRILIDKIDVCIPFGSELPTCQYSGVLYTKKGEPYLSGARDSIYQTNVIAKYEQ